MKKPKLVVDNVPPDDPSDTGPFKYSEFLPIAKRLLAFRKRYPEINKLMERARAEGDKAMEYALLGLWLEYDDWREWLAEQERKKLRIVKRRRKRTQRRMMQ